MQDTVDPYGEKEARKKAPNEQDTQHPTKNPQIQACPEAISLYSHAKPMLPPAKTAKT